MRQTENKFEIVGKLVENNVAISDVKEDGTTHKQAKGNIVLRANNCNFTVNIFKKSLNKNGEKNKSFDNIVKFLDDSIDEKTASQSDGLSPSNVSIMAEIREKIYVNKENKLTRLLDMGTSFFKYPRVVDLNTPDKSIGRIEGVIKKIVPEIVNEQETGRLIVTVWSVKYDGTADSFDFIAPNESDDGEGGTFNLAEAIEQIYNIGDTVIFDYEAVAVGQTSSAKKTNAFGRTANIVEGFAKTEYRIIGGMPPYEDEQVDKDGGLLKFTNDELEELNSERKIRIKQIETEGYKGGESKKTSAPKKKLAEKDNPFAKKAAANNDTFADDEDDDDVPF